MGAYLGRLLDLRAVRVRLGGDAGVVDVVVLALGQLALCVLDAIYLESGVYTLVV